MKKIIFNKLILDVAKFFLLISLSLSLIIWVVQAVNFLDYISEDGHGFKTYFLITMLNFPKILSRIIPFCVFISIFYVLNKYESKNELVIFWNIGINKIRFVNVLVIFSFFFLFFQLLLNTLIVPKSLDSARAYIRSSNIDFFPNLIKEKKFIDAVENLTIFVETKSSDGELKNIYLKDQIDSYQSQIIYAKSGNFITKNDKNYLILNNGSVIEIEENNITSFAFKKTEFNLSKYVTKTTIFPKFQEIKTKFFIECLYKLNYNKSYILSTYLISCNKDSESDIKEEIFKRIVKPFFIPAIVLISSLIILFNKNHFNYSKIKYILFAIVFSVIVISEISARYITNNLTANIFVVLPLIIFSISYLYLLFKLKYKL